MTLVAVASAKGAPGVTTTTLALAAMWPADRRAVVVEADPAGGDVAARFGIAVEAGAVTLATALRHERVSAAGVGLLDSCASVVADVRVLTAPISPDETRSALEIIVDGIPGLAGAADCDVIIDCGRLRAAVHPPDAPIAASAVRTPAERLLACADVVLLVTAAELADLGHVQALFPHLRDLNPEVSLVLRQPRAWSESEIEAELEVAVAGTLPTDAVSADILAGRRQARRASRLPLFRAAAGIAARIAGAETAAVPVPGQDSPVVATTLVADGAGAP